MYSFSVVIYMIPWSLKLSGAKTLCIQITNYYVGNVFRYIIYPSSEPGKVIGLRAEEAVRSLLLKWIAPVHSYQVNHKLIGRVSVVL